MRFSGSINPKVVIATLRVRVKGCDAKAKEAVGEAAARMYQRTVDLCPKDTFYMSEHVRIDFAPDGFSFECGWDDKDFLGTTLANGQPRPFYPPYVEFGTRKMVAQPSLSVAFAEEAPRFEQALAEACRSAMR